LPRCPRHDGDGRDDPRLHSLPNRRALTLPTARVAARMAGHATGATPEISVVVSTFERADMLADMLESLALQEVDAADFEVIVVDDCSHDHTPAVLATEEER